MTSRLDPGERLAKVGDVELCWQSFGDEGAPVILLVMGLGAQMIVWEDGFCERLAARGFRVVRFDNRDIGRSSRINAPAIPLSQAMAERKPGEKLKAPYLLKDMAADTIGLLDHLGVGRAHIVGASMGGMIAQEIAIHWPKRVATLTSIMSTTGDPRLPPPKPEALAVLMAPPPKTRDEFIEANAHAWRVFRGHGFPEEEPRDTARARRAADRGLSPEGAARQLLAVYASGSRKSTLPSVNAPTLVIHGADDPLVPIEAGKDTAASIPGAKLLVIQRMGHALPQAVWPTIIDAVVSLASLAR